MGRGGEASVIGNEETSSFPQSLSGSIEDTQPHHGGRGGFGNFVQIKARRWGRGKSSRCGRTLSGWRRISGRGTGGADFRPRFNDGGVLALAPTARDEKQGQQASNWSDAFRINESRAFCRMHRGDERRAA